MLGWYQENDENYPSFQAVFKPVLTLKTNKYHN
jgi:hypothetical protein